jgi:dTMP kinase
LFIVIEGTDGSGKATQTKLLLEYLNTQGKKTHTFDFPRYEENSFGSLVGRALKGEFGIFKEMSPYFVVLPYMIDQYMASREMETLREKDFVVCNRYVTTNFAYRAAQIMNPVKRKEYRNWLYKAAFEDLKMSKPDLVIVLYVPPKIAQKLIMQKEKRSYLKGNQKKDQFERDLQYQEEIAKCYKQMVKDKPEWKMVNCVDSKGNLKSIDEIHSEVIKLCKI